MFNPIKELSSVGILIENCLDDNERLVNDCSNLKSYEDKKQDGFLLGTYTLVVKGNANTKGLYSEINDIMLKGASLFMEKNRLDINSYHNIQDHYKVVSWLPPQPAMVAHSDRWNIDGEDFVPSITTLLYLTSDFEGGELHFPDHDITFKPKAGDIVSFFSKTKHEVMPVKSGRRITTQLFLFDN